MSERVDEIRRRLIELADKMMIEASDTEAASSSARNFSNEVQKEILSKRLSDHCRSIIFGRKKRLSIFPVSQVTEIGWLILLSIYMDNSRGKKSTIKSCYIGAGVAQTTALRHLLLLEEHGYIYRESSRHDRRLVYICLTDQAKMKIDSYLVWSIQVSYSTVVV